MTAYLTKDQQFIKLAKNSSPTSTAHQTALVQHPSSSWTQSEILAAIGQLVPVNSPAPQDANVLSQLAALCQDLIVSYGLTAQQPSPFSDVYRKSVDLYEPEVRNAIADKVILVTGGAGCVGSLLIQQLRSLTPANIVSVDIAYSQIVRLNPSAQIVTQYPTDVSNYGEMRHLFEQYQPDIVFHLAAERDPSIAEKTGAATLRNNVFGTQNIIRLCEEFAVEKCVFSSTGKAARYFTPDIYAGSKKICEWLFTAAAERGSVTYGAVRFTHIAENSIVSAHIDQEIRRGIVSLHSPDRYIYAQNGSEAVNLLLNALVFAQPRCLKLLTVRDLGWPIDILELALHKILVSGKKPPLYFRGLPSGYEDCVFAGHYDWVADNFSPMINFLESQSAVADDSGDMMVWTALGFTDNVLETELAKLRQSLDLPHQPIKMALSQAIEAMMLATFSQVPAALLQRVLELGLNPKDVLPIEKTISLHSEIIGALIEAIGYQENIPKIDGYNNYAQMLGLLASKETVLT